MSDQAKGIVSVHETSFGWWVQCVANTRPDMITACKVMGLVRPTEAEARADIPTVKKAAEMVVGVPVKWRAVTHG